MQYRTLLMDQSESPDTQVYADTNTESLINRVRLRQLTFFGHMLRMPEEEPCMVYALYTLLHGKRRQGRLRTLYLSHIRKLWGDTDGITKCHLDSGST